MNSFSPDWQAEIANIDPKGPEAVQAVTDLLRRLKSMGREFVERQQLICGKALQISNEAGCWQAALLDPNGMNPLTEMHRQFVCMTGKRSRRFRYQQLGSAQLDSPIAAEGNFRSNRVTAMRIKASSIERGSEYPEPRLMDVLHFSVDPLAAGHPWKNLRGWIGSPAAVSANRDPYLVPEGCPDAGHVIGRLWDLMNAVSALQDEDGNHGAIFAARSVEVNKKPVFGVAGKEIAFPLELSSARLAELVEANRDAFETVLNRHYRRPESAPINVEQVFKLNNDPAGRYLRPRQDGSRPETFREAMLSHSAASPTKTIELRPLVGSNDRSGRIVVQNDRETMAISKEDLIGFAIRRAGSFIRARVTGVRAVSLGRLSEHDVRNAGFNDKSGLYEIASALYGRSVNSSQLAGVIEFEVLGEHVHP